VSEVVRVGVLTVSDSVARGTRVDSGGPAVEAALSQDDYTITCRGVVPDDPEEIRATLRAWLPECDVIITTGGTGLSPRDVTPEATLRVVDRVVPGISEVLRAQGLAQTPYSMLSRGVAGMAGSTLIVNLPGNPQAVADAMPTLVAVLPHAVAVAHAAAKH